MLIGIFLGLIEIFLVYILTVLSYKLADITVVRERKMVRYIIILCCFLISAAIVFIMGSLIFPLTLISLSNNQIDGFLFSYNGFVGVIFLIIYFIKYRRKKEIVAKQ